MTRKKRQPRARIAHAHQIQSPPLHPIPNDAITIANTPTSAEMNSSVVLHQLHTPIYQPRNADIIMELTDFLPNVKITLKNSSTATTISLESLNCASANILRNSTPSIQRSRLQEAAFPLIHAFDMLLLRRTMELIVGHGYGFLKSASLVDNQLSRQLRQPAISRQTQQQLHVQSHQPFLDAAPLHHTNANP